MVKYDQSTIYKLCCNNLDVTEIYIGSTTNFNRRKNQHKFRCNDEKSTGYNYYVYQFIRNNGGFQNWSMVEIELFNARDKKNLHRRERYWIETEKASLNIGRIALTKEEIKANAAEYRANNKDKIKAKNAEYYVNNIDKIKADDAEYYANNKDKIKANAAEYRANNIDKIKAYDAEYRANNKDKIKENAAEYYANNKDKIKEKVTCKCGSIILKKQINQHNKTKKHQTFLQQ